MILDQYLQLVNLVGLFLCNNKGNLRGKSFYLSVAGFETEFLVNHEANIVIIFLEDLIL